MAVSTEPNPVTFKRGNKEGFTAPSHKMTVISPGVCDRDDSCSQNFWHAQLQCLGHTRYFAFNRSSLSIHSFCLLCNFTHHCSGYSPWGLLRHRRSKIMRNLYHLLFGTECKVHLMLKDVSLVLQVCGDPLDRIMWPTYVFLRTTEKG